MKKLEEIFENQEGLKVAADILGIIRESIFQKKDVGVPFFSIKSHLDELGNYDKDGKYSTIYGVWEVIRRLVEEDYLFIHPNSYFANLDKSNAVPRYVYNFLITRKRKDNIRIGLSDSYAKDIDYKYIMDEGLV